MRRLPGVTLNPMPPFSAEIVYVDTLATRYRTTFRYFPAQRLGDSIKIERLDEDSNTVEAVLELG